MPRTQRAVLALLALPTFVLLIDTTFMNVSISTLAADLGTTVSGIQLAITVYTLVMASLMVTGGKLGRIWGPRRAFSIGLVVYGAGAALTAASTNLWQLTLGWSVLEGIGAALVLPAVNALVVANFAEGEMRARAYATMAAVAAVGAAVGPLVGGAVTTYLSWRIGFAAEVVVVVVVLAGMHRIQEIRDPAKIALDIVGVVLWTSALVLIVVGLLQAGPYGWLTARRSYVLGGRRMLEAGSVSPVVVFMAMGAAMLGLFVMWERHRTRKGREPLLSFSLVRVPAVWSGSATAVLQYAVQAGILLALPIYLQAALGYSAFQTGLAILPMSIALFAMSTVTARLGTVFDPKRLVQVGMAITSASSILLAFTVQADSSLWAVVPGTALFGAGIGLSVTHLINTVVSSVQPTRSSEASGVLSTGQNLGRSLGTAVAGAVLLSAVTLATIGGLEADLSLTPAQRDTVSAAVEADGQFVSDDQITATLGGAPPSVRASALSVAAQARDDALQPTMLVLAALGALALVVSNWLPSRAGASRGGRPGGSTGREFDGVVSDLGEEGLDATAGGDVDLE